MYRQSLALTFRLYPYVLLFIFCGLVFGPLKSYIHTFGGETLYAVLIDSRFIRFNAGYFLELVVSSLLIFKVCEYVLAAENKLDVYWARQFGYLAAVYILLHIPALLLYLPPYLVPSLDAFSFLPDDRVAKARIDLFVRFIFTVLFLLGYCFLGTWLPAIVRNQRGGFGGAFVRGKQTYLFTLRRLLVGPVILLIILGVASVLHRYVSQAVFGWQQTVLMTIYWILYYIFYCWILVMTAWILSKAFLKTEEDQTKGIA